MAGGQRLWRRRARLGGAGADAQADKGESADELAVRQLGAIADRLKIPDEAKEILLGIAVVLAEAYRDAWEDTASADPGRRRADPRNWGDWRGWKDRATRAAEALRPLIEDAERLAITAGVLWPLPAHRYRQAEPVTAGTITFAAALSEEALTVVSFGASLAALLATIPVLEVLETYLTASARTNAYRRAELDYDVKLITADLHAGLTGSTQGNSSRLEISALVPELADWAIQKVASRVWQAIILGVGAALAGVGSAARVARVASLPVIRDDSVVTPQPPEGPSREKVADALRCRLAGRPAPSLPGLPA